MSDSGKITSVQACEQSFLQGVDIWLYATIITWQIQTVNKQVLLADKLTVQNSRSVTRKCQKTELGFIANVCIMFSIGKSTFAGNSSNISSLESGFEPSAECFRYLQAVDINVILQCLNQGWTKC